MANKDRSRDTDKVKDDEDFEQPEALEAEAEAEAEIAGEIDAEIDGEDEDLGDELDVAIDDVEDEAEAEAESADGEEENVGEAPRGRTVAARGRTKRAEGEALHTVAAREDLRRKLAADVEAFLKRGGAIQDVPQDAKAEPAKKPENTYGRGSA